MVIKMCGMTKWTAQVKDVIDRFPTWLLVLPVSVTHASTAMLIVAITNRLMSRSTWVTL